MSKNTGLVINDMGALMERAWVVELGPPDTSMLDYYEYAADSIVPYERRPLEDGDIPWLERRMLAGPETSALGRMAIIKSPFSYEDMGTLRDFAQQNRPTNREADESSIRSPAIVITPRLPRPKGALAVNDPLRVNKKGETVFDYMVESTGNMRTSTSVEVQGMPPRMGLHPDSWFCGTTPEERLSAPSRLGLNLGPGERSIIIAEDDMFDIVAGLGCKIPTGEVLRHTYAREYIAQRRANGGEPRALVVDFKPGEGYIVPTELRLHDGVTKEGPSHMAFYIGHYSLDDYELVV